MMGNAVISTGEINLTGTDWTLNVLYSPNLCSEIHQKNSSVWIPSLK